MVTSLSLDSDTWLGPQTTPTMNLHDYVYRDMSGFCFEKHTKDFQLSKNEVT